MDLHWTPTRLLLRLDSCGTSTGPLLGLCWASTGPQLDFCWTSNGHLTPRELFQEDLDWTSTGLLLDLRRKGNGRRCRQGPKVAVPSDSKAQPIYIGNHSTTPDLCHSFTCVQDKSNQSLERMHSPKEQRCENNKQVIGQREGRNLCTPRKTQGLPSSLVGSGHAVGEETAIVSGATARAPSSFPSLLDIEWTSIGPLLDLY